MVFLNPSKFYPIIKERWKNAVKIDNESDATSLAGFDVKFPSKLPQDYHLELGVIETINNDTKHVFLYYSRNAITASMRWNEFFIQRGITVYYRKWESQEAGFESHIKDYLQALRKNKVESSQITINGHKGIFGNQRDRLFHGYDIHDPSQIEFVMDETHVTLQGYFSKDELIQFAQSVK